MTLNDFHTDLNWSHQQADQPWWEHVYRQAFPRFQTMTYYRHDGPEQRLGIDRRVDLDDGNSHTIDEKVRRRLYGDILLERYSNVERQTPGWANPTKPTHCDFIAYAFAVTGVCYLLPVPLLRRALVLNGAEWMRHAADKRHGFRWVDAHNDRYTTRSLAVPVRALLEAIADAMVINFTAPGEL